jgi:ADP-ribosyl-[dinitrogen reductase] hydrolase
MRVAPIGVCHGDDLPRMRALVRAATRVTHTDPKAEHGALAVALAAHLAADGPHVDPADFARRYRALIGEEPSELPVMIDGVAASVASGETTAAYAARNGWEEGISGYILHTVPAALHAWLAHQDDYRAAVIAAVRLGGDTDTTAAIVGAIVGARVGKEGIPADWISGLREWPRSVGWMERLAARLATCVHQRQNGAAVRLGWPQLFVRNAAFVVIVLCHGFRRLLPPY